MSSGSRPVDKPTPDGERASGEPHHALGDELEVLLVDNHLTIRRGLQLLLAADGMRIAGVASDAQQAQALLARRRVDVVLIARRLRGNGGAELTQEVLALRPKVPVVLYAPSNEPDLLERMRASGAPGIVLTSSEPSELIRALRAVAGGGTYTDPALGAAPRGRSPLSKLTRRENEVLNMLAEGLTGQGIADELHLSPDTVRTHVLNASVKLGAKTRAQAVALSIRGYGRGG